MKNLIIAIAILTITVCCMNTKTPMQIELGQRVFECDSALNVRDMQLQACRDSLRAAKSALFLSNYKVEKVKYYIKICQTKPTNNKFFKGWVIRAVK